MTLNKTKLTVVQVLPELHSGGVERGTLELGKYLHDNGHTSIVVSAGGRMTAQLEQEGSRHHELVMGKKNPISLLSLAPFRKLLIKEKVDVLHLRSRMPAWMAYLAWLSIPETLRPLLITTFHGFYSINCYSAIMAKGEGVIAVSGIINDHIREHYTPPAELKTIHRGVDLNKFDPKKIDPKEQKALIRKWNINPDYPTFLLPGRFTRLKGQDIFIQALGLIRDLSFNAIFIGDHDENPTLTKELTQLVARYKLQKKVKFSGHCTNMPLACSIADCIISANSITPESFGRTVVEGMAMEKIVIATGHGGSLETVLHNKTGWLVPPGDISSLASQLKAFLFTDSSIIDKMKIAARQRVVDNFSTQKMCEKTVAFYQELLAARNR